MDVIAMHAKHTRRGSAARLRALLLAVALAAPLLPARVAAQQDAALDRVQNLIATGRFTEARSTLEQWEAGNADPRSSARPADRARALFLRGSLSTDPRAAEDAYLAVVLSYPSAGVAPEALLRLGQGLLTAGEAQRAVGYLDRLRNDYPGAAQQEAAWLWLARAQHAAGAVPAACSTARNGAAVVTDMNLRMLLELERDRTCPPGAQTGDSHFATAPRVTTQPAVPAAGNAPDSTPATAHAGDFAVQTGAYREYSSANNIATQMRARGFDVRIVLVGDSPLHRVRFGTFASSEEAAAAARAVRDAGFATIIVNDVRRERR